LKGGQREVCVVLFEVCVVLFVLSSLARHEEIHGSIGRQAGRGYGE